MFRIATSSSTPVPYHRRRHYEYSRRRMICRRGSRRRFRVVVVAAAGSRNEDANVCACVYIYTAGKLNLSSSFGFIARHLSLFLRNHRHRVYCIPRTTSRPTLFNHARRQYSSDSRISPLRGTTRCGNFSFWPLHNVYRKFFAPTR